MCEMPALEGYVFCLLVSETMLLYLAGKIQHKPTTKWISSDLVVVKRLNLSPGNFKYQN